MNAEVAHLQHEGAAAERSRHDEPGDEPEQHDPPDRVQPALANPFDADKGGRRDPGNDESGRVAPDPMVNDVVHPERDDRPPDDARRHGPDRGRARFPAFVRSRGLWR